MGTWLTFWTVRLALLCYAAVLGVELGRPWPSRSGDERREATFGRWLRAIWSAGCVLMLVHVACAFHFYHEWSHAEAQAATARQVEQLVGVPLGWGIYFNYAYLAVWVADAAWWWIRPALIAARPILIGAAVHLFMVFMAFNGAVVFAAGAAPWVGLGVSSLLVLLLARRLLARKA
jgi:hypothetical protein